MKIWPTFSLRGSSASRWPTEQEPGTPPVFCSARKSLMDRELRKVEQVQTKLIILSNIDINTWLSSKTWY